MRWFWWLIKTSVRVVWRGTWQAHSIRLITGVLFAGLAALFSYLATNRVSALVGVLAYPAGLALIYGFDAFRWLTGWHWRWGREWSIQSGGALQVTIFAKGPLMIESARERTEDSCVIWDPMRQEFRTNQVSAHLGQGICFYPNGFSGAPPVMAGIYWVQWQERKRLWRNGKPLGPGKWHPVDFYRVKIKTHHLAAASPGAVGP